MGEEEVILRFVSMSCMFVLSAVSAQAEPVMSKAELFERMEQELILCQEKSLTLPAANSAVYTTVTTSKVCAPTNVPALYRIGVEADCAVKYRVSETGIPRVESSECNTAFNGNFEPSDRAAFHLDMAKQMYEFLSLKSVERSRLNISSAFEADALGLLVQPYEFLHKRGEPHLVEPVLIPLPTPHQPILADELVDQPEEQAEQ
ncbi:MAG: hypothetical protein AAGM84_18630 [Pseudomonadota bacterium]